MTARGAAQPAHSPPADPQSNSAQARIDGALASFLDTHRAQIEAAGEDLTAVADTAHRLVFAGGKRLRPLFSYWGWRCVHGPGADLEDELIVAAASLEMLHVSALVHDDLIDGSTTRRGQPAAHTHFATLLDDAAGFGAAAAILLGDLLLSWSSAMLASARLPVDAARAARLEFDAMSAEMMAGQYLDVLEQSRGGFSVETALRVARFKSAKYTVERPLLLGAGAGGAGDDVRRTLSDFAVPLGEAFQLRDDVLGVFGDPQRTGKPAGDDLREGKRTVLVALAHAAGDRAARDTLARSLGRSDLDAAGIEGLRTIVTETGALEEVERMIAERFERAGAALDEAVIRPDARSALLTLADTAVNRLS